MVCMNGDDTQRPRDLFDELDFPTVGLIDQNRVNELFEKCICDDTKQHMLVEGIKKTYLLSYAVLEANREEILAMLDNLPNEFKATGGKGASLLNACDDKTGQQWASTYDRIEQLFLLGMGLNVVQYLLPRALWSAFPRCFPYYIIAM